MKQTNTQLKIAQKPSWMPLPLWVEVKGNQVAYPVPRAVKRVARKRKKIPCSDWAEQHRPITVGPLAGTRYRKDTVPYADGIMDASFFSSVEEIVLCCADQVSKSFIIETCLGYLADMMPGPVAYTFPDKDTTTDNIKDRLLTMFRQSPRLKKYMTGHRQDESLNRIDLVHMPIYATWAGSPARMANKSIKYVVADEVDKFPDTAGKKEGAPLDKLRKRFRTYTYGRKMWISSTPTIEAGAIWVELNDCNVVFEYHVACPDCETEQAMEFEQIKWPEDMRNPAAVMDSKDMVHYVCPHCGSCWGDAKRNAAVKWGRWRAMMKSPNDEKTYIDGGMELFEYLEKHRPRKIGFHVPSWLSRFVKLKEVAAAFLASLKNKTKLKDFNNSHAARPWTDHTQDRKEDAILRLCDDRPRGVVPGGGVVNRLVATLDTQGVDERNEWYRYEVRAWGWGDGTALPESWQVREGRLESFKQIEELLIQNSFYDAAGNEYKISFMLQDAMGRRTHDVIIFCTRYRGLVWPTQGRDTRRMTTPHTITNWEYFPGTKKPIPGGLKLIGFDNFYYKNQLAAKLEINPDDPGAWHLHHDTDMSWAQEMCAETIDPEKMQWVTIHSRANHAWDCSVLQCLAAEMLWLKDVYRPKAAAESSKLKGERENKGGFVPKKDGWLKR